MITIYRIPRLSLNSTVESSLYQSALEDSKSSIKSEELYVTVNTTQSDLPVPIENNHSELYFSATQELYVNTDIIYA